MKPRSLSKLLLAHCLATLLAAEAFGAPVPVSPEQEIARLARTLRPIADDRWQEIAGQRVSERYTIAKGDTLYDVSKRLFGDARYWPKIWALNNLSITNPHMIRPGRLIAFMPGTGGSLPSVSLTDAPGGGTTDATLMKTAAIVADASTRGETANGPRSAIDSERSQEWRSLPHQSWEDYSPAPAPAAADIVSVQSRVRKTPKLTREVDYYLSTREVPRVGDLYAAQSSGSLLGSFELVYVKAPAKGAGPAPVVGRTYTITHDPVQLRGHLHPSATADAYPTLGAVRIIGKRGKLWLGRIVSARQPIRRGDYIVAAHHRIRVGSPLPSNRKLTGSLILDRSTSTFYTAQHAQGFVDLGSAQGIRPGMVFRAYQEFDRGGGINIDEALVKEADFQVMQVAEHFSLVLALNSFTTVSENAKVTLLADVSDVGAAAGLGNTGAGEPPANVDEAGGDGTALPSVVTEPKPDGSEPTPESELSLEPAPGADPMAPPADPLAPPADEALPPPPGDGQPPGLDPAPAAKPPAAAKGTQGVPGVEDELDRLNGDDLRPDEERELKQLEEWKQNPATRPDVELSPPPAEDLPPPPGAETLPTGDAPVTGDAPGLDSPPPPDAALPAPPAETQPGVEVPPGLDSPPPPPPGPSGASPLTPNSEPGATPSEADFMPPPPPPPS